MKKNSNYRIVIFSLIIVLGITFGAGKVMGVDPGSNQDPLVSKSYVDSQIKAVMDIIGNISSNQDSQTDNHSMTYEVINVPEGKSLIGNQGTEVILRGGKGFALTSIQGGLQDMTEGADIVSGQEIPKYHLLIIPRDDGRGIYVEKDAVFMVRGKYEILP